MVYHSYRRLYFKNYTIVEYIHPTTLIKAILRPILNILGFERGCYDFYDSIVCFWNC